MYRMEIYIKLLSQPTKYNQLFGIIRNLRQINSRKTKVRKKYQLVFLFT